MDSIGILPKEYVHYIPGKITKEIYRYFLIFDDHTFLVEKEQFDLLNTGDIAIISLAFESKKLLSIEKK